MGQNHEFACRALICHILGMFSASLQKAAAQQRADGLLTTLIEIGTTRPLREIAAALTRQGIATARGGPWHPEGVARLFDRLGLVPGVALHAGGMPSLPLRFINAVITSPPHEQARRRQSGGIDAADYPAWTVAWMERLRPVLVEGGSIAIIIRPHVKGGQISDYVLNTRLAARAAGWYEIEELIWIKPSSVPRGHARRPRRSWESILWFSNSTHPYCDAKANGPSSERIGHEGKKGVGEWVHGTTLPEDLRTGVARSRDYIGDVVKVSASAVDRHPDNDHSAITPQALAEWLIRLLCPPKGVVLDPFVGSGTTAAAAKATGRRCVGVDIDPRYIAIAKRRLARMRC